MGIKVLVISSNVALWNYMDEPKIFTYEYIGHIGESFHSEQIQIRDYKVKQFMYIDIGEITIFSYKQVKYLEKEIEILEKQKLLSQETLDIIKNAIKVVLESKNLYLKFEYD